MQMPEWLTPLALVLAVVAGWRWSYWKGRARRREQDLAAWKEALHAVAYESTNAANAIRANLLDFRQANRDVLMPQHLDQIATGIERLAALTRIADDPVSWHRNRKQSRAQAPPAAPQPAAPMIGDPDAR